MVREHSEKPLELNYKCEQCPYQTYLRQNIARHMRVNHDPNFKMFRCSECDKAFKSVTHLEQHADTHAEGVEYACDVCSHVSKTKRGIKSHMTLHQELKYECPVCLLKRRSAYEVRMHCQRKHPDYELPPKFTVLKTTSTLHGRQLFTK